MICQKCGKEIPNDSDFCQYCGKKLYKKIINVEIIIAIAIFIIIALLIFFAIFKVIHNKKIAEEDMKNLNNVNSNDIVVNSNYSTLMVYMSDDITNSERDKLKNEISSIEGVESINFISKEEAFERAKNKLGNNSIQMQGYTKENHPFPASFSVVINSTDINGISSRIENLNNVKSCSVEETNKEEDLNYSNKLSVNSDIEENNTTGKTREVEEYFSNMSIDQIEEFDFQPEVEVETDESGPKWNTSEIYREYKTLLDRYNSEASNKENMEVYYMITDINNDDIPEIIFSHGAYNGDFIYSFYTFKDHKIIKIGQNVGAYSTLYKVNEGNYLKQVYLHGDYELIYDVYYENGKFEVIDRGDRTLAIEELSELDYEKKYNAKVVAGHELSDMEELNNLR